MSDREGTDRDPIEIRPGASNAARDPADARDNARIHVIERHITVSVDFYGIACALLIGFYIGALWVKVFRDVR